MKLLLSSNYILRGWRYLPYAYVDLNTGNVSFLSKEDFLFLSQCDGKHEIVITDTEMTNRYIEMGIVKESKNVLSKEQLYKKYPTRFIKHAHWAITNKCNYKCKHCFISAPHFSRHDITLEECYKIIDELYSCGIFQLSITGGEPLIRKDLIDLLRYIKNKHITISDLYSNGSLITEPFLQIIKSLEIKPVFHISYDGVGTHNWMRGILDAEDRVKKAIQNIIKLGFPVHISCCLYNDNLVSILDNIDQFASLGVKKIDFGLINHTGEWKNTGKGKSVSIEDILNHIILYLPELVSKRLPVNINIAGFIQLSAYSYSYSIPEAKNKMKRDFLHNWVCCETMRNTLYINPEGKLLGCEALTNSVIARNFPNILENSLEEILIEGTPFMNFIDQRLSELEKNNNECPECSFYDICHGGCRGNANEAGSFWGKDPIACTFFKKGFYNKIVKRMESLSISRNI